MVSIHFSTRNACFIYCHTTWKAVLDHKDWDKKYALELRKCKLTKNWYESDSGVDPFGLTQIWLRQNICLILFLLFHMMCLKNLFHIVTEGMTWFRSYWHSMVHLNILELVQLSHQYSLVMLLTLEILLRYINCIQLKIPRPLNSYDCPSSWVSKG